MYDQLETWPQVQWVVSSVLGVSTTIPLGPWDQRVRLLLCSLLPPRWPSTYGGLSWHHCWSRNGPMVGCQQSSRAINPAGLALRGRATNPASACVRWHRTEEFWLRFIFPWFFQIRFCFKSNGSAPLIPEKIPKTIAFQSSSEDTRPGGRQVQSHPSSDFEKLRGQHQIWCEDWECFEIFARGRFCYCNSRWGRESDQTIPKSNNGKSRLGWRSTNQFQAIFHHCWSSHCRFREQQHASRSNKVLYFFLIRCIAELFQKSNIVSVIPLPARLLRVEFAALLGREPEVKVVCTTTGGLWLVNTGSAKCTLGHGELFGFNIGSWVEVSSGRDWKKHGRVCVNLQIF